MKNLRAKICKYDAWEDDQFYTGNNIGPTWSDSYGDGESYDIDDVAWYCERLINNYDENPDDIIIRLYYLDEHVGAIWFSDLKEEE